MLLSPDTFIHGSEKKKKKKKNKKKKKKNNNKKQINKYENQKPILKCRFKNKIIIITEKKTNSGNIYISIAWINKKTGKTFCCSGDWLLVMINVLVTSSSDNH